MESEIKMQVEKLLEKTKEGKVDWKQINQNAIRWTRISNGISYIVTLQTSITGIINSVSVKQFILTIQSNTGEVILQLQSNQQINSEYFTLLQTLFELALKDTKAKSANILNNLLDDL